MSSDDEVNIQVLQARKPSKKTKLPKPAAPTAQSIQLGDLPWPTSCDELKSPDYQARLACAVLTLLLKSGASSCGLGPVLDIGRKLQQTFHGCNGAC